MTKYLKIVIDMRKGIGILLAFNGLSMLIVWPLLIINNQVPEMNTNLVYICHHLVSEFVTALISLFCGVGILLNKKWSNNLFYPASGFFVGAGYLAIGYYIFSNLDTALPVLVMLIILNILGVFFFISDLNRNIISDIVTKSKLLQFFQGVLIYALINIAGFLAEMNSGYTYAYLSMVYILILYFSWSVFTESKLIITQ